MEKLTEVVVPYLASTLWYQAEGNISLSRRDYARTLIESNTPDGMMLSVPVVGGAAAAKRLGPDRLEISGHGDWTRIHLGAIEAAYGREPYFQHLFPAIARQIADYPPLLADLNANLHRAMLDFISYDSNIHDIRQFSRSNEKRYDDIRLRLQSRIDPSHSILEALFRLGTDTLFLLP